ncbi:MAG TPA: YCF48-related protein [Candidatus Cloacimonadota bacterium]|nr:YCF48-related protein [Candidatus Cloacimonadota bacterium]HPT71158.1 YCF48-related protein [Candidatus Cloacimonadota bacterium]
MRSRILICLALLLTIAGLWGWSLNRQCEFPANFYNMDVVGSDVWAIGTAGAVAHSTNGGNSYSFVPNPGFNASTLTYIDLNDVDFYDTNHGIIVGESGLAARTDNGGTSWTVLTGVSTVFGTTGINSVVYHSDGKVWICGATGAVAYSSDNGDTWTAQTSGTTNILYSISMNDTGTGFFVGNAGTTPNAKIYRTTDYGTTWTPLTVTITNNPHLYQVKQFGSTVVVMGDKGYVGVSTDNGDTWTPHDGLGGATIKMQDACYNGTTGYVVAWSSTIYKTTDNFATFTPIITNFGDYFEGISYNATGDLIAACWKGDMLKSADSGVTWAEKAVPINFIYGASVVNDNTWFLAGDNGYMTKTTDGGATFQRIVIPTGITATPYEFNRFYTTYFKDANEGWVTGKTSGKIYHTTDGGATWSYYQVPGVTQTKSYYEIQFINATTGFVFGVDVKNAKTTDGGATWTALGNSGIATGTVLYSCYFVSELVGYATSTAGKIYLTADGGATWTLITVGTTDIMDIYFKDAQHGVFVAKGGNIYYTSNGGLTATDWTVATESSTADIYGLYCDTDGNFYASAYSSDTDNLGNAWAVMKSADNGATWTQEVLPALTFNKTRLQGVTGKSNRIIAFGGNQVVFSKSLSAPPQYATDLFISEYLEGSSNNKSIEIFNGTGAPVSLSNYSVKLAANGGAWSTTLTTNRVIANNDVFIISNAGANATIQAVTDTTSTVTYFNGNDAVGLFKNGQLIDTVGQQGTDPGTTTGWPVAGVNPGTQNHTMVRKPNIGSPTTDWAASAGTNADDSQWLVYPIDTFTYLGSHTMNLGPVNPTAGTPTFNPPAGLYPTAINLTLSSSTAGAAIHYTTDGTEPSETSTLYTAPIPLSTTTTVKARAYFTGMDPSFIASATYNFPVSVPNLTALHAATADGTTVYRVAGEIILTFQQTFRHQKFFQDANAGVLFDESATNSVITTAYNLGDGVTGVMGTITVYAGMLEFVPVADPGAPTSTGNVITPISITLAELNTNYDNYKERIVKIQNVSFTAPTGNFANGMTYAFGNGTDTANFRTTFYDVDYIGTPIPTDVMNMIGIPNSRTDGNYFSSRNLADFEYLNPSFPAPTSLVGTPGNATVHLQWNAPGRHNGLKDVNRSLTGYQVYRDGTALGAPVTTLTYDDNTVTNGTPYTYYVKALYQNPTGESVASNSVTVTPISVIFNPPTALSGTPGNASVALTWSAPRALDKSASTGKPQMERSLSGYKVYRGGSFLANVAAGTLTYTDNTVTNGTAYTYYVTAVYSNPDGESAASNSVTVTPQAPVLNPPANLTAQQVGSNVVLNWVNPVPAAGTTLLWINIYRNNTFVTNIAANLTTWTDENVANGQYTYKISAGYQEGESAISNEEVITAVEDQVTVTATALLGAYPNPFKGTTSIHYQVKGTQPVTVEIYNIRGQHVRTLLQDAKANGLNTITWNGTDENNRSVPVGVYFYKMKSGNYSSTKKVILLK